MTKPFREFLNDYESKEMEELERFRQRVSRGERFARYPLLSRFPGAKEPLAYAASSCPVWGLIPFYGSTLVGLAPVLNQDKFDDVYSNLGFTSRNVDRIIDFVKETGRLQFYLGAPPTKYEDLGFLEPLLAELKPPLVADQFDSFIGKRKHQRLLNEFLALASLGFEDWVASVAASSGWIKETVYGEVAQDYVVLKALGFDKVIDKIGDMIIIDPSVALNLLIDYGRLLKPAFDPLRAIKVFKQDDLATGRLLGSKYYEKLSIPPAYEIGKFILNKTIRYATTIDGCRTIIQQYDDYALRGVLEALHEGVRRRKLDAIKMRMKQLDETLESIWSDAAKVKQKGDIISLVASFGIGLVGEFASGIKGMGLLASFGFQVFDKIFGAKLTEKLRRLTSANYLVTVYNFKSRIDKET